MPTRIRSMHGAPDSCHWIGFRLMACQRYRGLRSSTRLLEAFCNPRKLTLFYNHRALRAVLTPDADNAASALSVSPPPPRRRGQCCCAQCHLPPARLVAAHWEETQQLQLELLALLRKLEGRPVLAPTKPQCHSCVSNPMALFWVRHILSNPLAAARTAGWSWGRRESRCGIVSPREHCDLRMGWPHGCRETMSKLPCQYGRGASHRDIPLPRGFEAEWQSIKDYCTAIL